MFAVCLCVQQLPTQPSWQCQKWSATERIQNTAQKGKNLCELRRKKCLSIRIGFSVWYCLALSVVRFLVNSTQKCNQNRYQISPLNKLKTNCSILYPCAECRFYAQLIRASLCTTFHTNSKCVLCYLPSKNIYICIK